MEWGLTCFNGFPILALNHATVINIRIWSLYRSITQAEVSILVTLNALGYGLAELVNKIIRITNQCSV